ncbi:MAG: hypothetical protein A2103_00705 [Gammaproteobacteria bacterium GWF2_41_13]|nr:MAG: hypothetical protein A2103_00705 [Gammaproteobacteria bacterium GWF2_41_13]
MKAILTLNAGSSSIKFAVFSVENNTLQKIYAGFVDNVLKKPVMHIKSSTQGEKISIHLSTLSKNSQYVDPYERAIRDILDWLSQHNLEIIAAGHRLIHGSTKYRESVVITPEIYTFVEKFNPLAPLHQPYNLRGYSIVREINPDLLQVFCFDTSFHTTCNELSQHFALPKHLHEEGVRRYGFHGLSYAYVVSQFDHYLPEAIRDGKIIIAHLGAGASMCAIHQRKSVATTLSFSALDGLPMGTRCGNIDPGVLLYLMEAHQMDHQELSQLLYRESGLLGLSGGISADMRDLENSDSPDAQLAIDVFAYKIAAWIGMLAAELQGLDGLIFTAGIGENSALVREKICARAAWLGAKIDPRKNVSHASVIHAEDSRLSIHVIPTNEELMIAQETLRLLLETRQV